MTPRPLSTHTHTQTPPRGAAPRRERARQGARERAQASAFASGVAWGEALALVAAHRTGDARRAMLDLAGAGWIDRSEVAIHLADVGAGDLADDLAPATDGRSP